MKVTLDWLKDFVEIKIPAKELAKKLTMAGLEVISLEKKDTDWLFDIEVTTNRPDCLSVIGLAGEVSAIIGSRLKAQGSRVVIHKSQPTISRPISIEIKEKGKCRGYLGRVMENVKVKPSPEWLRKRLTLVGIRPVNNIVDITNFILLETGQPLHSFDYDKLTGSKIVVRLARENERLITLDGAERALSSEILVIADLVKPIAIAGVMGGKHTEVTSQTKNILLESAYFAPSAIRQARKLLGINTESSYRFERGVEPEIVSLASQKAICLITELAGGRWVEDKKLWPGPKLRQKQIILRPSRANQILGMNLSGEKIKRILGVLQLKAKTQNSGFKVTVPSFRQDLSREIDLIEEVIRIEGYDKIPTGFPYIKPKADNPQPTARFVGSFVKEILISQGLNEILTYSLLSQDLLKKISSFNERKPIFIKNPLSSEQQLMRPSLIPGLLSCLSYNFNRQMKDIKIFEMGYIYSNETPKERLSLAIALTGRRDDDWLRKSRDVHFFDLKGILEALFEKLGINTIEFLRQTQPSFLCDDKSADLILRKETVGFMGQVSKKTQKEFELSEDVYVAEVSFDRILSYLNLRKKFEVLPKHPFILRDIAIVVKEEVPSARIIGILLEVGSPILTNIKLFDQYYGEQIPQGYKSLAYSLTYQLKDRTLTDQEVTQLHTKICQVLVERLEARIR